MNTISAPARKRLVVLSRLLSQLSESGKTQITSDEISSLCGWKSATIRRDIFSLGGNFGGRGGYEIDFLKTRILASLGLDESAKLRKCCIVGLGRLGSILLDSPCLDGTAFSLVAGFDSSPNRTEILRSSIPLYPTTQLESVIKSEKIEFALLAVSSENAQKAADRLVSCGIRGIVNYTDTILLVPEKIAVENVSPANALSSLLSKL